jgi:cold shock CspA family protein
VVESGTVSSFDDAAGVGRILDRDGRLVDFHCVAIADGSRRIAEGAAVTFSRRFGPTGRLEAVDVRG